MTAWHPKAAGLIAWSVASLGSAAAQDKPPEQAISIQRPTPMAQSTNSQTVSDAPAPETTVQRGALTREALLRSSREHYPEILAAMADRAAAAGELAASRGAFDLFLESDAKGWLNGFYGGSGSASAGLERRFRNRGGALYGEYRLSEGDLPVYEDIAFTNNLGELKIGAIFPLMRDRTIDADRARVTDLTLAEQQAATELFLVQVGVQRRALIAYWNWIASGEVRDVYADLLATAEERQSALEQQFEEGAVARIALVENSRVIANRARELAAAEQAFLLASNGLSLFWRTEAGDTRTPPATVRPPSEPLSPADFDIAAAMGSFEDMVDARPEIEILALGVDRARQQIAFRQNDLKPRLDLNVEVSRDFGGLAEGGRSRDSTDVLAGIKFSLPLGQTKARGDLVSARSDLRARRLREKLAREEAELEVRNILTRLSTAFRIYLLSEDEMELARQMSLSERRLFETGASDLFLIIAREEDEARARLAFISAQRDAQIAKADFAAATVDTAALGLEE